MKLRCGEFVGLAYANDDELREFAEEILAENAKLRKVASMMAVHWLPSDIKMTSRKWDERNERIRHQLAELGIEVSE